MSKDSCAIQRARMERENQIESKVQLKFDRLDKEYLGTHMSSAEYHRRVEEIQQWAREQYGIPQRKESI